MFDARPSTTGRISRKILLVILAALTVVGARARAHGREPIDEKAMAELLAKANALACEAPLTGNEKFARRPNAKKGLVHFGIPEMQLMTEALLPVTRQIREFVVTLDAARLRRDAYLYVPRAAAHPSVTDHARLRFMPGLDGVYEGRLWWDVETPLRSAYNAQNRGIMLRLTRAVTLLHHYRRELMPRFADVMKNAGDVFDYHSFSGRDLNEILTFNEITILQVTALLTVSPVGDLSAGQLLERVAQPYRLRQSLINRLSLEAPPGMVTELGQFFYLADPVVLVHGEPKFSPKFKELIELRRASFVTRPLQEFESGRGCPMGHKAKGCSDTGVQNILDAVMHIYRGLEGVPQL